MAKNLLKYLSVILTIVIVFTQVPLSSFASDSNENSIKFFLQKIEKNEIYIKYFDEIDSLLVSVKTTPHINFKVNMIF